MPVPRLTTSLDTLYGIGTPESLMACLNAFQEAFKEEMGYLSQTKEDKLLEAVISGEKTISPELYGLWNRSLRKAVEAVPMDDTGLQARWLANVSRFAAYKAWHSTRRIREADGDPDKQQALLHAYKRYHAAECNTATARARTGKQWLRFTQDDNRRLFPNIRWLPSRSATPREEHIPFYNRVWPKDDPFWQRNQPGNLWNCKCDWEETDDPPTSGNPDTEIRKEGLEGNPAETGEIFTDNAGYIRSAPEGVEMLALNATRKDNLSWALENLKGTKVENSEFGKPISFTSAGIRDYINQPIGNPFLKNELIRNMPELLENANYMGYSDYKSSETLRHSHIFEITVSGRKYWIIVHEYANNDISFYSITDNPLVLKDIKKRNTRPLE